MNKFASSASSGISAKFRPSLTAEQIAYLIGNLQAAAPSTERDNILTVLHKFHLKAVHGIVSPSHVSAPRMSLVDSLGFSEPRTYRIAEEDIENLLDIYNKHPNSLSAVQLGRVQYHRYTNDMMTPQEEKEYESSSI